MEYIYHGDKITDPKNKKQPCKAIRKNSKCWRGKNSNMLVKFAGSDQVSDHGKLVKEDKDLDSTLLLDIKHKVVNIVSMILKVFTLIYIARSFVINCTNNFIAHSFDV
jgi:hypothetical protein